MARLTGTLLPAQGGRVERATTGKRPEVRPAKRTSLAALGRLQPESGSDAGPPDEGAELASGGRSDPGYSFGALRIHCDTSPRGSAVHRDAESKAPQRVPASVTTAAATAGKPLPAPLRTQAESFFSTSLAHVRIHDDADAARAAAQSRAHALSVGPHIL